MTDEFVVVGAALAFVAGIFGLVWGALYLCDRYSCAAFEATGYTTMYAGFTCYAKVDGKWIPRDFVFGKALDLRAGARR